MATMTEHDFAFGSRPGPGIGNVHFANSTALPSYLNGFLDDAVMTELLSTQQDYPDTVDPDVLLRKSDRPMFSDDVPSIIAEVFFQRCQQIRQLQQVEERDAIDEWPSKQESGYKRRAEKAGTGPGEEPRRCEQMPAKKEKLDGQTWSPIPGSRRPQWILGRGSEQLGQHSP